MHHGKHQASTSMHNMPCMVVAILVQTWHVAPCRIISGPGVDLNSSLQDEVAAMEALAALPCPSPGAEPLICEALAYVDLPCQQLQLLVELGGGAEGSSKESHQQRHEDCAGSSCSTSSSCSAVHGSAVPFGPPVSRGQWPCCSASVCPCNTGFAMSNLALHCYCQISTTCILSQI